MAVVWYFQVHQPFRLRNFDTFEILGGGDYFASENEAICKKVAKKCYLPAGRLLLELLEKHGDFRVTFGISGLALEQFEEHEPEVLELFGEMVATGRVELLAETYYHSLASVFSGGELVAQVNKHEQALVRHFGCKPRAFRNTELIYDNELAELVMKMGYTTILAEGVDRYLGWRSPNFVYQPKGLEGMKLLLKNYRLSDDVAFRFSSKEWEGWPLTAKKFAQGVGENQKGDVVNLFMDYETLGEHQWADSGIFEFLADIPAMVEKEAGREFLTVSQAAEMFEAVDEVDMPETTSWADMERDTSAWLGNPLQQTAARAIYELEEKVVLSKNVGLLDKWRKLQASDHFYYMSTKGLADGEVHRYFSPHDSPFEAYVNYMNVLHDIRQRV